MTFKNSPLAALERLIDILLFILVSRSLSLQKYALLKKENEILKRKLDFLGKKVDFQTQDRYFHIKMADVNRSMTKRFTLVTPKTVLGLWKKMHKARWRYSSPHRKGRPPISKEIRKLILRMKKENPLWGVFRISGELAKLNIDVSRETVRRVVQKGRKESDILPNGSWGNFLKSHWDSLFACDFFTVETLFGYRYYIFFLLRLNDRKIMQYGITKNPTREFLSNQIKGFLFDRVDEKPIHLIHDNSGEMRHCNFESMGVKNIPITPYSPDMNTYAERFIRSVRTECLDHFIIMHESHLRNLIKGYVEYYNHYRPHQGLRNRIPSQSGASRSDCHFQSFSKEIQGKVRSKPILFGLHHHYSRKAA